MDALAVAYLLSGGYGYDARLGLTPNLSLNQLLGLTLLGILAARCYKHWRQPVQARATLLAVGVLTVFLALGLPGSVNQDYARFKLLSYVLLILPMLLYAECALQQPSDLSRMLAVMLGAALALTALGLPHAWNLHPGQRLAVLGGGPNVFARIVGSGVLCSVALAIEMRARRRRRLARLALVWLPAALLVMIMSGSKAALMSLLVASTLLLNSAGMRALARGISAILVLLVLLPLAAHPFVRDRPKDGGLVRLLRMPDIEDSFGSYGSRLRYMKGSWEQVMHQPWRGVGTGAWGNAFGLGAGRNYPHNLEVEIAVELGFPALVLMVVPLALFPRRRPKMPRSVAEGALVAIVAFWFLNVQLSGDVVDGRYLWWFVALLEICRRMPQKWAQSQPAAHGGR